MSEHALEPGGPLRALRCKPGTLQLYIATCVHCGETKKVCEKRAALEASADRDAASNDAGGRTEAGE